MSFGFGALNPTLNPISIPTPITPYNSSLFDGVKRLLNHPRDVTQNGGLRKVMSSLKEIGSLNSTSRWRMLVEVLLDKIEYQRIEYLLRWSLKQSDLSTIFAPTLKDRSLTRSNVEFQSLKWLKELSLPSSSFLHQPTPSNEFTFKQAPTKWETSLGQLTKGVLERLIQHYVEYGWSESSESGTCDTTTISSVEVRDRPLRTWLEHQLNILQDDYVSQRLCGRLFSTFTLGVHQTFQPPSVEEIQTALREIFTTIDSNTTPNAMIDLSSNDGHTFTLLSLICTLPTEGLYQFEPYETWLFESISQLKEIQILTCILPFDENTHCSMLEMFIRLHRPNETDDFICRLFDTLLTRLLRDAPSGHDLPSFQKRVKFSGLRMSWLEALIPSTGLTRSCLNIYAILVHHRLHGVWSTMSRGFGGGGRGGSKHVTDLYTILLETSQPKHIEEYFNINDSTDTLTPERLSSFETCSILGITLKLGTYQPRHQFVARYMNQWIVKNQPNMLNDLNQFLLPDLSHMVLSYLFPTEYYDGTLEGLLADLTSSSSSAPNMLTAFSTPCPEHRSQPCTSTCWRVKSVQKERYARGHDPLTEEELEESWKARSLASGNNQTPVFGGGIGVGVGVGNGLFSHPPPSSSSVSVSPAVGGTFGGGIGGSVGGSGNGNGGGGLFGGGFRGFGTSQGNTNTNTNPISIFGNTNGSASSAIPTLGSPAFGGTANRAIGGGFSGITNGNTSTPPSLFGHVSHASSMPFGSASHAPVVPLFGNATQPTDVPLSHASIQPSLAPIAPTNPQG